MKGQVIGGEFGGILVRQKTDNTLQLGELLTVDNGKEKMLLQVTDLTYGSQISQQNLEMISGLAIEENTAFEFMDPKLRNHILAKLKNLISITEEGDKVHAHVCKTLPTFFSHVRALEKEDVRFITKPAHPLFIGNLRSGSRMLDVPIFLPGKEVFSHHILVAATTGRGKSNLLSVMLYSQLDEQFAGILVLDPHDEYYGRNGLGLKDHAGQRVMYYTPTSPPAGAKSLLFHIGSIKPHHFQGVIEFSDPQFQALSAYYKKYGMLWIESLLVDKPLDESTSFHEGTIAVVRRKILQVLELRVHDGTVIADGIFHYAQGTGTVKSIVDELEEAKTVIIDTSALYGAQELLVGSLIANEIFSRYKYYKTLGTLEQKPVISVVIEEAPRVLGKEVLERGSNVFDKIAREGRKFKVGLTAITQVPSAIPRTILANMNTKIILGIEMAPERQAIIESSAQDLSEDARTIAALDKGEAIITSTFTRFAVPVKVPLFPSRVEQNRPKAARAFAELR